MFDFIDRCLHALQEAADPVLDGRKTVTASPAAATDPTAGAEQTQDWMEETTLHPLAVVLLSFAMSAILFGRRSQAVLAYLLFVSCVSGAQNFNIAGTSWYLLRILILCGIIRCLFRGEWKGVRWNSIDAFVAAWTVAGTVIYVVQQGQFGALIYKIGTTIDCAGGYFVFRGLLKDKAEIEQAVRSLAVVAVPVSVIFVFERLTQFNLFSMFGGVPVVTIIRQGRLRCQGPFPHPILAGVFWATNLPLFVSLVISNKSRILGCVGSMACLLIIVASSSSTPVMGVAAGLMGTSFFLVRRQMRFFQLAAVFGLCALHMMMKAPVWHLLARADVFGGSTGHYRFMLVDASIRFFSEWYLVGLASNEHWGQAYGHYLTDTTNQYILEGLRGGALSMALFAIVMWCAFGRIGLRLRSKLPLSDQWLAWSLGVALFVHAVSFMAVSYFGQIIMLYYVHLAMISSWTSAAPAVRRLVMLASSDAVAAPSQALERLPLSISPRILPS